MEKDIVELTYINDLGKDDSVENNGAEEELFEVLDELNDSQDELKLLKKVLNTEMLGLLDLLPNELKQEINGIYNKGKQDNVDQILVRLRSYDFPSLAGKKYKLDKIKKKLDANQKDHEEIRKKITELLQEQQYIKNEKENRLAPPLNMLTAEIVDARPKYVHLDDLADPLDSNNQELHFVDLDKKYAILADKIFDFRQEISDLNNKTRADRQQLRALLQTLPEELQLLKVLYSLGKDKLIVKYLQEYLALDPSKELDKEFLNKIERNVDDMVRKSAIAALEKESIAVGSSRHARSVLRENPGIALTGADDLEQVKAEAEFDQQTKFEHLTKELQDQLIEQRMFVLKLNAYLQETEISEDVKQNGEYMLLHAKLDGYYKKLKENIEDAMYTQDAERNKKSFADISAKISWLETYMRFRGFKASIFTGTNLKVVGAVSTANTVWNNPSLAAFLMEVLSGKITFAEMPVRLMTLVLSGSVTIGRQDLFLLSGMVYGLSVVANEDSKQITQENFADLHKIFENPLLAEKLILPQELEFILELDQLFKAKTHANQEKIAASLPPQTFFGQFKRMVKAIVNSIITPLGKLFSWSGMSVRGVLFFALVQAPLLSVATIASGGTALAVAAVFAVLWQATPILNYLGNVLHTSFTTTINAINAVKDFCLQPINGIAQDFTQKRYFTAIAKISIGVVAGLAAVVYAPFIVSADIMLAVPELGMAVVGLAGSFAGLSFAAVTETVTKKIQSIFMDVPELTIHVPDISKQEAKLLHDFNPDFDKILMQHFRNRFNDLNKSLDEKGMTYKKLPQAAQDKHFMQEIDTLRKELTELEQDWDGIKNALSDPTLFAQLLNTYLDKQFIVERQNFIKSLEDRLNSSSLEIGNTNKAVLFKNDAAKILPFVKDTPSFQMQGVQHKLSHEKLDELAMIKEKLNYKR